MHNTFIFLCQSVVNTFKIFSFHFLSPYIKIQFAITKWDPNLISKFNSDLSNKINVFGWRLQKLLFMGYFVKRIDAHYFWKPKIKSIFLSDLNLNLNVDTCWGYTVKWSIYKNFGHPEA